MIDIASPGRFNYEPHKNGELRLGAVQYFVVEAAWDAMNASPPSIGGQEFEAVPEGAVPGLPTHYSLHAWVWRNNRSGM